MLFAKKNGGQGSARNFGVSNSKSKYICFLDQDDYYLPNHNQILMNSIPKKSEKFGWVYADLQEADSTGRIFKTYCIGALCEHPKRSIYEMLRNDLFILPSASLISRKAFTSVGGFDEQFIGYEDDDLFLRMFLNGYSNYYVNKQVTVWQSYVGSTSRSIRMARSRIRYVHKLCESFPEDMNMELYFIRDLIFERFFPTFYRESKLSINRKDHYLSDYKEELLSILVEFEQLMRSRTKLLPKQEAEMRKIRKLERTMMFHKFKKFLKRLFLASPATKEA